MATAATTMSTAKLTSSAFGATWALRAVPATEAGTPATPKARPAHQRTRPARAWPTAAAAAVTPTMTRLPVVAACAVSPTA